MEQDRRYQSTRTRCLGTGDVGTSSRCLRSRVDGRLAGNVEKKYFPSGGNVLLVVKDTSHCSAVVVERYVPYFRSGHNALCVVRDISTKHTAYSALHNLYVMIIHAYMHTYIHPLSRLIKGFRNKYH